MYVNICLEVHKNAYFDRMLNDQGLKFTFNLYWSQIQTSPLIEWVMAKELRSYRI